MRALDRSASRTGRARLRSGSVVERAQRDETRPAARARRPVRLAAIGVLALTLAGCANLGPATPSPGEPVADPADAAIEAALTVEIVQLRSDVSSRQAQVRITNGSDVPIEVGDVAVVDTRLDGPATRAVAARTSTVPAGRSVDVRVQLPAVACTADADDGPSEVELEVVTADGARRVTASATDPLGFLPPLHARECRVERLAEAATVEFTDFRPSPPGEPAALELTITPTGGGEAVIAGVQQTNLIDFAAETRDGAYPLDVVIDASDRDPVVVDLPIRPTRCDPHAVQEDKRGTLFRVWVSLDGEPGDIEVYVGDDMRGRILTWVPAWCAAG